MFTNITNRIHKTKNTVYGEVFELEASYGNVLQHQWISGEWHKTRHIDGHHH